MGSIKTDVDVICPNKCRLFNVQVITVARADLEPHLKESIINGELNLLKCPDCKTLFYYDEPIVYLDTNQELLVFLFSDKYKKDQEKWRSKMAEDFEILKNGLLKELNINFAPMTLFGTESLKKILDDHQDLQDESDIISCLAENLKLNLKKIAPSVARSKNFPLVIAFETKTMNKKTIASACAKVLKGHSGLKRLKNFLKLLETSKNISDLI